MWKMSGLPNTTYFTLAVMLVYEIIGLLGGLATPVIAKNTNYSVYWNVPTFMCRSYNVLFDTVVPQYGIIQNPGDDFNGPKIYTLNNPGMFPEILVEKNGRVIYRNGGLPQRGNLDAHLSVLSETVNRIPTHMPGTLVVINHEIWRPTYRQHFHSAIYSNVSERILSSKHPDWEDKVVHEEAVKQFEEGAKKFMEETLKAARARVLEANWSYRDFPQCFKDGPALGVESCSPEVREENDKLAWLFTAEDMILPSVHLLSTQSLQNELDMIRSQVGEAVRMAKKSNPRKKVFVYFDYSYADRRDIFLTPGQLIKGAQEIIKSGADGYILWGDPTDFDSREKCERFLNYFILTLGQAVIQARTARQ